MLAKEELTTIQTRLEIRIPVLLRRLYTEVADGGFGPEDGILGLGKHGHRDEFPEYNAADWYKAIFDGDRRGIQGFGVPLVEMTSVGWSTGIWIASVAEAGNPVRWWDPSLWRRATHPRQGGFLVTVPTLNEWWGHWLADSDRLQEFIDQAESDARIG